jgi:hypothetical protein
MSYTLRMYNGFNDHSEHLKKTTGRYKMARVILD